MNEEELRKEAEEYANKKVPKAEMPIRWNIIYTAYLDGAKPRGKHIEELEKENVDLQKSHQDLYNSMRAIKDQRNKALDILKRLVGLSNSSRSLLSGTWFDTLREAEQFLK